MYIGIENQTDIDYDEPKRVIGYDGAVYRSQILKKENKDNYPVATLVLYFGEKRWTGEYSDANEHSFRKFRAPLSGKTVHVFPEVSAMSIVN